MAPETRNDRSCSRKPVNMDVTLIAGHGIPFHATLTNVSFDGGYITTSNKALMPKTQLTLVLQKDEDGVQRIFRMSATVVRQDHKGAGIAFNDFDPDTVRSLRTIYKETRGSSVRSALDT